MRVHGLFSHRQGVLQHALPCHDLYTFSEQKNMEGFMTQSPMVTFWLVPKAVRFLWALWERQKSQESPCTKLRSGVHPGLEPV